MSEVPPGGANRRIVRRRTDELFAADSEVVHAVRCLARGDVAFTPTAHRWETREGNRPDKVAVRS